MLTSTATATIRVYLRSRLRNATKTREGSSDLSLREQSTVVSTQNNSLNITLETSSTHVYQDNDPVESNHHNASIQYSFVTIESMDENDVIKEEIVNITGGTNDEENPSDEMVFSEVITEYLAQPDLAQAAVNNYPHIFIKSCDGAKEFGI